LGLLAVLEEEESVAAWKETQCHT